jgi:hypothetical protein
MAIALTVATLFAGVWVAAKNWRRGLFAVVAVGLLQDPLRKLWPNEPVYFVLLAGVVFAAAALGAMASGISISPQRIWGWRRYLALPFGLFVGVLLFQAANSWFRFGNIMLPSIGLISYLTPLIGLCVVYQMIVRSSDKFIENFLGFYVVATSVALTTLCLQYVGFDWAILGEVGQGMVIFDSTTGAKLSAFSGTFRSSEVAAWHAAAVVCFGAILLSNQRMTLSKALLATVFVLAIIALGMITGRRKFLVIIVMFISVYATLFIYYGRGIKLAVGAGLIGFIGILALNFFIPEGPQPTSSADFHSRNLYQNYVSRTKSVFGDVPDRFTELGLAPIGWAYNKYGLFGAGLGAGSQGTQHFGASAQGAAEGGLGKIWLELGAPGFFAVVFLGWVLVRHIWRVLNFVSQRSKRLSRISYGLVSFLIANLATFAVASQVFGDIFVLLLIGTALGTLLAMPVLCSRQPQPHLNTRSPDVEARRHARFAVSSNSKP